LRFLSKFFEENLLELVKHELASRPPLLVGAIVALSLAGAVALIIWSIRSFIAMVRTNQRWRGLYETTGLYGYVPSLAEGGQHPRSQLPLIRRKLDFMGGGARKWTADRELLEDMLRRTYAVNGTVRILLLNPECQACKDRSRAFKHDERHFAKSILESLKVLHGLQKKYPHLLIHIYDEMPAFRLTFLDEERLTVGHYQFYEKGAKQSPLHIYYRAPDWSFYKPYIVYFEHVWNTSSEPDWPKIERLHRAMEYA